MGENTPWPPLRAQKISRNDCINYVLGLAPPDVRRALDASVAHDAQIAAEIDLMRDALAPDSLGDGLHSGALRLEAGMEELRASSCTFYVRDPVWPGELRLAFMPGVKFPETMHGFNMPASAKRVIADGAPELFLESGFQQPGRDGEFAIPPTELRIPMDKEILFRGFAGREGVRSSARLLHVVGKELQAVLFVNFNEPTIFDDSRRQAIKDLMSDMVEFLPAITHDLREVTPLSTSSVVRIHERIHHIATNGLEGRKSLQGCLKSFLAACLEASGIPPRSGLGTIHLFEPETFTLHLAAASGRIDRPNLAKAQSVCKGDGIITWVALRKRPLLIDDLERPPFDSIHKKIRDGVRSEVAVPMLAGDDVGGVINFECTQQGAFSSEFLRIMCRAADQLATAYRLHQQTAVYRERAALAEGLLDVCHRAATAPKKEGLVLDDLADSACKSLRAGICDIWRYNSEWGEFDLLGSTEPKQRQESAKPREEGVGWSHFVRQTRQPVWITNIGDETHFDAYAWQPELKSWKQLTGRKPETLSKHVISRNVEAELGIPILVGTKCVGVAWLKYQGHTISPSEKGLSLAEGLVGALALVLYKTEAPLVPYGQDATKAPSREMMSVGLRFGEKAAVVMDRALLTPGRALS
jgi:GAF domain